MCEHLLFLRASFYNTRGSEDCVVFKLGNAKQLLYQDKSSKAIWYADDIELYKMLNGHKMQHSSEKCLKVQSRDVDEPCS